MKTNARRYLKGIAWLIIAAIIGLGILTGIDEIRVHRYVTKAILIPLGCPIEDVIALMGQPTATIPKGGSGFLSNKHKTLAYGTRFDWQNSFQPEPPFFFPFNMRLFGPHRDDIAVILDDDDKVLKVEMPE
jgi:hypothetical protein